MLILTDDMGRGTENLELAVKRWGLTGGKALIKDEETQFKSGNTFRFLEEQRKI